MKRLSKVSLTFHFLYSMKRTSHSQHVKAGDMMGKPIKFEEVVRPYMVERKVGKALISGIHFPGRLTVPVGSFVALFPWQEKREWYLFVTSVRSDGEGEVCGYFAYTDFTVRKETGCKDFKSGNLFLTHQKFTTALSTVKRVVPVLPAWFAGGGFPEETLYYDSFYDVNADEVRRINFQLSKPGHLFSFLASNTVLTSGGGERNLFLFRREFRVGLEKWADKWRDLSLSPKRGVRVPMNVDLEQLLSLPFGLLETASVDLEQKCVTIVIDSESQLKDILGKGWATLQRKARRVKDGELLQFEFHLEAKVVYYWSGNTSVAIFHGASQRNGAGVLQWSTLPGLPSRG